MRGGSGTEVLWSHVDTVAADARDRAPFYVRQVRVSRPRIRIRMRLSLR